MRAVGLYKYLPVENPESLLDLEIPKPEAAGRDLLVRVHAVSVNPVDTKVRAPKDKVEVAPRVLGWDAAGIVEAVGDHVTLFKPGDEVYYAGSITRPGSNSEFHLVDERITGRKPRNLSFEDAAAMPLTTITAYEALFDRMGVSKRFADRDEGRAVREERSLLIIGGAGGVGSIAIQLAKQLAGLRVIATASRTESSEWCRSLGADEIINHHLPFQEEFKKAGLPDVDYVLCLNSTEKHMQNMADVIKPQGRLCTIVETKGSAPVNINLFQRKSVAFCWELMFTRAIFQTADMQAQHDLLNEAASLFENGTLRSTRTMGFGEVRAENLRKAHAEIERGDMIGKVTLTSA
ncbi:MAG TPA: zinc-binding alcohol dehydrogenase family protein [Vicinamibacterales bacterium]|nr:zinc-binding alcohol dehydrogenase family protein [Vicinamibacterales bacterium]